MRVPRAFVALALLARSPALTGCPPAAPAAEPSFAPGLDRLHLDRRLTESRLWGTGHYAPWAGHDRGGDSRPAPAVIALAARAQQDYLDGAGPLGDYGLAVAAAGDLDEGIEALESAARAGPRQAEWFTDVAALYLERNHPVDVVRALDASARASVRAAGNPAPLFSAALALGRLHLTGQAVAAWKRYLTSDDSAGWKREANEALTTLSIAPPESRTPDFTLERAADLAKTHPEQARIEFETRALPEWARRCRAGGPKPSQLLSLLARTLADSTHDMLYVRTVADAEALRCGSAEATRFSAGIDAYVEGRRRYESDDPTGATVHFERARQDLARVRATFVVLPEFYL